MARTWSARQQPWATLPPELSAALMPHLGVVSSQVMAAAQQDVPVYAGPIQGQPQEKIRFGVELALTRFLQLPGTNQSALAADEHQLYLSLGRKEFRQGRPMNALFAAYRSGARTTLHSLSEAAMAAGFDSAVLIGLAESVFAYIEELSAASAEGYAIERSEHAGERDRLRDAAAALVIRGHGEEAAVRAAAQSAGWTLPERVVVALLDTDQHQGLRTRLDERALVLERTGDVVVLGPEPGTDGDRRRLETALAGRGAMIGPARPWRTAHESLALAQAARDLLAHEPSAGGPPHWVSEHLLPLILRSSRALVDQLARQRLAPMESLKPAARQRLQATLLSWLRHQGRRSAMAAELGIHEQTVGYRINQLRELFGDQLDRPQVRFELELVLRAAALDAEG